MCNSINNFIALFEQQTIMNNNYVYNKQRVGVAGVASKAAERTEGPSEGSLAEANMFPWRAQGRLAPGPLFTKTSANRWECFGGKQMDAFGRDPSRNDQKMRGCRLAAQRTT